MAKHKIWNSLSPATRVIFVTTLVLAAMGVDWTGADSPRAQSVGPSGCVALCGGGASSNGSSSGGGAGCARSGGSTSVRTARGATTGFNNAGLEAKQRGDFKRAISLYRQALAANPNHMTAYRNLGHALNALGMRNYNSGKFIEAVRNFDESLNYIPFSSGTYWNLRTSEEDAGVTGGRSGQYRTCGICGKALLGDVNFGLDSSASFRIYVQQSQGKFQNCQRKFYDGACNDTRGRIFFRNLDSCNSTMRNETGFKSCVDRMLRGSR